MRGNRYFITLTDEEGKEHTLWTDEPEHIEFILMNRDADYIVWPQVEIGGTTAPDMADYYRLQRKAGLYRTLTWIFGIAFAFQAAINLFL